MLSWSASVWPFAAALFLGAASHALARETRGGFNVKVQVRSSGHAANLPKSSASASGASNELRLSIPTSSGYLVRFEVVDPAVEHVEIRGLGPVIRITSGAREVFVPPNRDEQTITYSVEVRPGSRLAGAPPVRATLLP
ncbi:MAG TPA: hypothetical protein VN782_02085 [Usitatibacter sp.]|nr:hypothetical protein [Usitatibacter sp.]